MSYMRAISRQRIVVSNAEVLCAVGKMLLETDHLKELEKKRGYFDFPRDNPSPLP